MSNPHLIVEERARNIGDFMVGRLLPFRKKRSVGPFLFFDHMGPSSVGPGRYMDVDQHPHIGLSTLTYLLEGAIEHRDSMGNFQLIEPGAVNWMTAGKGCTHTERSPAQWRIDGSEHLVHGYQIWVALPQELEEMAPSFQHVGADELPRWIEAGASFTLIAGEIFGKRSPVKVYSPLFLLEVKSQETQELNLNDQALGEVGILVVDGNVLSCGEHIQQGQLMVATEENRCHIQLGENTHLLIFGGPALAEERFMDWNFVSSTKERILQARHDWKNRLFPQVAGDNTYIPHPLDKL